MARVDNPDDVPPCPPHILQQRADLSEVFRQRGPEYVNQVYPGFYSGKAKMSAPQDAIPQQSSTVKVSSLQSPIQHPTPSRTDSTDISETPLRSCCQPRAPESQPAENNKPTFSSDLNIKPEDVSTHSEPHFTTAAGHLPYAAQINYNHDVSSSIGSSTVPWTEPRHREMHTPDNVEEQYNCECGSDCSCLGCRKYYYYLAFDDLTSICLYAGK